MGILSDVEGLRRRAQKHIEAGAITDEYNADRAEVVNTLNTLELLSNVVDRRA